MNEEERLEQVLRERQAVEAQMKRTEASMNKVRGDMQRMQDRLAMTRKRPLPRPPEPPTYTSSWTTVETRAERDDSLQERVREAERRRREAVVSQQVAEKAARSAVAVAKQGIKAVRALTALRELHVEDPEFGTCQGCRRDWPCQTAQIIAEVDRAE